MWWTRKLTWTGKDRTLRLDNEAQLDQSIEACAKDLSSVWKLPVRGGYTHNPPRAKTPINCTFFLAGSCSFHTIGHGMIRIMMSVVTFVTDFEV